MNLETGEERGRGIPGHWCQGHKGNQGHEARAVRWGMPVLSDDGALAVAHVRACEQQGSLAGRRRSGDRQGPRARRAARRCVGARGRRVRRGRSVVRPAAGSEARLVPVRARRLDAPLQRRRDGAASRRASADAGQVGDRRRRAVRRPEEVLHHEHRGASGRAAHLRDADRRRRADEADLDDRRHVRRGVARRQHVRPDLLVEHQAERGLPDAEPRRCGGDAGDDLDQRRVAVVQVGRAAAGHLQDARRRRRLRAAVHAGDGRRQARSGRAGGGVRARRRLPAERAQVLVQLLPRVHVPQPAGVARLRRARSRLPRQRRLRPRLAHGDLPPHGRQGSRGRGRRREVSGRQAEGQRRSGSASTAAATAASSR